MLRGLLELVAPSVCPACDAVRVEGAPLLCETCDGGLEALARLGRVRTAFTYRGTALRLIQRLKFESRRDALDVLVPALALRIARLPVDVLVPVPRHWTRIRREGCDPVHDLARALARQSGVPLFGRVLRRARAVPPQTGLGLALRAENVRGSFRAAPRALRGMRVLLFDDVTTTGATLLEAERALAPAEPRRVVPVAVCGTPAL